MLYLLNTDTALQGWDLSASVGAWNSVKWVFNLLFKAVFFQKIQIEVTCPAWEIILSSEWKQNEWVIKWSPILIGWS